MLLKKVQITGFRPFYETATLKLEPTVTVLTGANDAGKSAILDTLRRFSTEVEGSIDDANIDFLSRNQTPWNQNREIRALSTYVVTSDMRYLHQPTRIGWEVDLRLCFTLNELQVAAMRESNGNPVNVGNSGVKRRPKVIDLDDLPDIGTSIGRTGRNPSENMLLDLAFGENSWNRLESLDNKNRNLQRDIANEQLNQRLARTKPNALKVKFFLDFESHDPLQITVGLVDDYGGRAFPHLRGAGYQKLMRLMLALLTINVDTENLLILFDEPENSLHADAQHSFSRVLEDFAQHPNIQIVYATHSPAMINRARPKSVRLLYRDSIDRMATTRIVNKPYTDENFQMIRSSLGISPADSLLYGPITVIIEGATESLGFDRLFKRLIAESSDERHADLDSLVGLVHFLGGGGTSFARWARMAHSQRSNTIVFVDGDQINNAKRIKEDFPEVPIVHFTEDKEFEDIVTRDTYFQALTQYAAANGADASITLSEDEFEKWEHNQGFGEEVLFSKRAAKWYKALFNYNMEKAEVMDLAIKNANLDDMDLIKINELIKSIREAAENLR